MNNEQKKALLETTIKLLSEVNTRETETIDVDSTTYDDGSSSFTVTVNYPIPKKINADYIQANILGKYFKE